MTTGNIPSLDRIRCYKSAIQPYESGGRKYLQRHWAYINFSTENQIIQGTKAVSIIVPTALAGGAVGYVGGYALAGLITDEEDGKKLGGGVGFTVGLAGGAAGGFYIYLTRADEDHYYQAWNQSRCNEEIDKVIADKCAADDFLKDYNDTIMPQVPPPIFSPVKPPEMAPVAIRATADPPWVI